MRAHPEKRQVENPQADDTTVSSYLIFSIGKQRFAFKSSLIQEIMYGSKIHHLPFVPDYVEGVLNCRGNPYTVINSLKLDNEQNSDIESFVELSFWTFAYFFRIGKKSSGLKARGCFEASLFAFAMRQRMCEVIVHPARSLDSLMMSSSRSVKRPASTPHTPAHS